LDQNIEPYTNNMGKMQGAIMLEKKKPGGMPNRRADDEESLMADETLL
jgi:hypothetical protein